MKICICNSCGKNEGTIHVSVTVVLFSAKSRRQKVIQFWLCEPCELENRAFLERDNTLRDRVAKALTPSQIRYPKFQWMTEPETPQVEPETVWNRMEPAPGAPSHGKAYRKT